MKRELYQDVVGKQGAIKYLIGLYIVHLNEVRFRKFKTRGEFL